MSAAESSTDTTKEDVPTENAPYEPTIVDVLVVKAMLNKALSPPQEIIDRIVDLAEYWPHTTSEWTSQQGEDPPPTTLAWGRGQENVFVLRAPPLGLPSWRRSPSMPGGQPERKTPKLQPAGEEFPSEVFQRLTKMPMPMLVHPCRQIVFTIRSRDQGWGGEPDTQGTYNSSWTWFEAGLERWCKTSTSETDTSTGQQSEQPSLMVDDLSTVLPPVRWDETRRQHVFDHPLLPREDLKIQCNEVATNEIQEHRVVWSYNDDIDPDRDTEAAARLKESGRGTATGTGKFVRDLKLGDVVTVWSKARFAGWQNHVSSVKVTVYYAV